MSPACVPLPHHVAVRAQGVRGLAAAGLAAGPPAVVPVVGGALVTAVAHHVLPAGARARHAVAPAHPAVAVALQGAGRHTRTAWGGKGEGIMGWIVRDTRNTGTA